MIKLQHLLEDKPKCRHTGGWKFVSHSNFKDGEYWVCNKCGKTRWTNPNKPKIKKQRNKKSNMRII